MNKDELEKEIAALRKKVEIMNEDLKKFSAELSATSQVAIIARIVLLERDIEDYEAMLDTLKFEEIVGGEF
jgi:predicted component of viral defense system (DUF524 family)